MADKPFYRALASLYSFFSDRGHPDPGKENAPRIFAYRRGTLTVTALPQHSAPATENTEGAVSRIRVRKPPLLREVPPEAAAPPPASPAPPDTSSRIPSGIPLNSRPTGGRVDMSTRASVSRSLGWPIFEEERNRVEIMGVIDVRVDYDITRREILVTTDYTSSRDGLQAITSRYYIGERGSARNTQEMDDRVTDDIVRGVMDIISRSGIRSSVLAIVRRELARYRG